MPDERETDAVGDVAGVHRCITASCDRVAMFSYVWLGKPDRAYACADCFKRAGVIAGAMGFQLGDPQIYVEGFAVVARQAKMEAMEQAAERREDESDSG